MVGLLISGSPVGTDADLRSALQERGPEWITSSPRECRLPVIHSGPRFCTGEAPCADDCSPSKTISVFFVVFVSFVQATGGRRLCD